VTSKTYSTNPTTYSVNTGTGNLRKHLISQHTKKYEEACEEHGWNYLKAKVAGPTIGENRKSRLPPFSPEAFLEYLVRFVSTDDQVSRSHITTSKVGSSFKAIRVVECPEFRDLCMLLRESLNDKDIPRRDKLREAIINQFGKEFARLKVELSVG
jgi:hypothetical protein